MHANSFLAKSEASRGSASPSTKLRLRRSARRVSHAVGDLVPIPEHVVESQDISMENENNNTVVETEAATNETPQKFVFSPPFKGEFEKKGKNKAK